MAGGAKAMKALQIWCRQRTDGYRDVHVADMTKSWRDGLAFCALVHKYRPDLIDYDSLSKENVFENNKLAFEVAERELGIPALLDAEDMVQMRVPDRLSIITYVAQMYNYFKDYTPQGGPDVKKYKGTQQAKRRQAEAPPPASEPEIKKPAASNVVENKTRGGTPAASREKTRTIGDTCTICSKKVYILERVRIEGKFYHRSCYRESQNKTKESTKKNAEYTSVLLKKTSPKGGESPAKPETPKRPENKPAVVSPTAKARSDFFQTDNVSNKSVDSGYQSPKPWKHDGNGVKKDFALSSPTSPVRKSSPFSANTKTDSDDPWVVRASDSKDKNATSPLGDTQKREMDRLRQLKERSPFGNRSPLQKTSPEASNEKPASSPSPFVVPPSYDRKSRSPERKRGIDKKSPVDDGKPLLPDTNKTSPMDVDSPSKTTNKRLEYLGKKYGELGDKSTERSPRVARGLREKRKSQSPVEEDIKSRYARRGRSPEQRADKAKSGAFPRNGKSPEKLLSPKEKSKSPEKILSPREKSRSPDKILSPREKSRSPEKIISPRERSKSPNIPRKDQPSENRFVRKSLSPESPEEGSGSRSPDLGGRGRISRSPVGPSSNEENRFVRKSKTPEKRLNPFNDDTSPTENVRVNNRSPITRRRSPEKSLNPFGDDTSPTADERKNRSPIARRSSPSGETNTEANSAMGRLDALLHQKNDKTTPAVPSRPRAPPHFGAHLAEESVSQPEHPVPKPRVRRDSSGSPVPRPRSPRRLPSDETAPPKPVRTFERDVKPAFPSDAESDPALSGLLKSLAEVRAHKARPKSDAQVLDREQPRGSPEARPRRRSLEKDNIPRRPSPPRQRPQTRVATEKDVKLDFQKELERRKGNIKESNTPEEQRKKRRPAPGAPKTEWQKAAESRQAANKIKFNRYGSRMKDERDGEKSADGRPRPARPDSIPARSHHDDEHVKPRVPRTEHKMMRPARPPTTIVETSAKPNRPQMPASPNKRQSGADEQSTKFNLTDQDKSKQGLSKLTDVLRQKTKGLNPFDETDEDLEEDGSKEENSTEQSTPLDSDVVDGHKEKPDVVVKPAKPFNPFDSDEEEEEEDETKANEEPPKPASPVPQKRPGTTTLNYDSRLNPFGSSGDEEEEEAVKPRKKITVDRQFDFDKSIESSGRQSPTPVKDRRKKKGHAPAPPRPLFPASPLPVPACKEAEKSPSPHGASPLTVPSHKEAERSASPRGVRQKKGPAPARPLPPKRHIHLEPHVSKDAIQRELDELDKKQTQLEVQGRELEEALRSEAESGDDDSMLIKWFEMVNEKNQLLRRENDLVLIAQRQELEARHSDVEYQIRLLMNKPENKKTDSEKRQEQILLDQLLEVVTERSKIEEKIEMERVRAQEEDQQIAQMMALQGMGPPEESPKSKNKKKKDKKKKK